MNVLNKKSGVYGITKGLSSDFRDLEDAAAEGNELAKLALSIFAYDVAKYIGAYAAAMNGVDAIAFTAGIGENGPDTRTEVAEYLGYLGIKLDEEKNQMRGFNNKISTEDTRSRVRLCDPHQRRAGYLPRDSGPGEITGTDDISARPQISEIWGLVLSRNGKNPLDKREPPMYTVKV